MTAIRNTFMISVVILVFGLASWFAINSYILLSDIGLHTNELVTEETPRKSKLIKNVPLLQQNPELARGCEVTSLAMLLHYHGYPIDKMELAKKIAKVPFQQENLKGSMHKGFVGEMATLQKDGLGVYVEPIVALAQKYVSKKRVINLSGEDVDQLYKKLDAGLPVWVITNSWFKVLPEDQFQTWKTAEGTAKVTYRQHSVVLTGYNDNFVFINDPMKSTENISINRMDFENSWIQMGGQAMTISK